jgi:hypothetical protein
MNPIYLWVLNPVRDAGGRAQEEEEELNLD